METEKVFEETIKLGNEIRNLGIMLEQTNRKCYKMMELCPHEIVFKYNDNHPRKMVCDGNYFCPACGKSIRLVSKTQIGLSSFKDSRIIPLTNLSLVGTSELLYTIRNEVYQNMDLYYNDEVSTEDLEGRMEDILKDQEVLYDKDMSLRRRKL